MLENTVTLTQQEIKSRIYKMILPITVENILQMTAGIIAMAMVGRIDTVAIGAVGLSSRITQMIWALFRGVTTGATVFVAQAYGAGDFGRLKRVTQQTLLSSIILVVFFQTIIYTQAPTILRIFGAEADLLEAGILYLRVSLWGIPFLAISLVVAGVLQGMGNAKTPMKIALIMNGVNVVLSYILIFGRFGFAPLGLKGSAIATVLSQVTAAVIGVIILFSKNGVLGKLFNRSFFKINFKQIGEIYGVGMPAAAESLFWQFAAIILTKRILTFGEDALAAYQLGLQAESISYMPAMGFGVAATALVGQALGAKDRELSRRYLMEIIRGSLAFTIASSALLIFMPKAVMGLLTNQPEVIKIGVVYLVCMGFVQIPQNIAGVLNGALRGAGYTKIPMIVAAIGIWGIRIPFSIIFTKYLNFGVASIWVIMAVDLLFRFLLSYALFRKKDIYSSDNILEKVVA